MKGHPKTVLCFQETKDTRLLECLIKHSEFSSHESIPGPYSDSPDSPLLCTPGSPALSLPGSFLSASSLPARHWDYSHTPPHLAVPRVPRIQTHILRLVQGVLYPLSPLSSPQLCVKQESLALFRGLWEGRQRENSRFTAPV